MTQPEEDSQVYDMHDSYDDFDDKWDPSNHISDTQQVNEDEDDRDEGLFDDVPPTEFLETKINEMRFCIRWIHLNRLIGPKMGVQLNAMSSQLAKMEITLNKLRSADTLGKLSKQYNM